MVSHEMERHYHPGVFLEEINMAEFTYIVYEGLESMKNLKELKTLNMANCSNIDDWCIDRICGEYHKTLEHLDLSNCTRVTERGVAALARLSALKSLNLSGLDQVKDIKLLCLLLEDVLPSIKISGIDYLAPQALNQS